METEENQKMNLLRTPKNPYDIEREEGGFKAYLPIGRKMTSNRRSTLIRVAREVEAMTGETVYDIFINEDKNNATKTNNIVIHFRYGN